MTANRILVRGVPYERGEEIGRGLHSTVYGGRNLQDGRPVAIKIINFALGARVPSDETLSRRQIFWKELEMLLYLQSLNPFVIRIFNYDCTERHGIIVMERGRTFRDTLVDYLISERPIPASLTHRFWSQMVEAIYYMHRIGIVHGDCKPENFIQVGPGGNSLKLIDMGISFQLAPNMTSRLMTAAGTPGRFVSCRSVAARAFSRRRLRLARNDQLSRRPKFTVQIRVQSGHMGAGRDSIRDELRFSATARSGRQ